MIKKKLIDTKFILVIIIIVVEVKLIFKLLQLNTSIRIKLK